MPLCTSENDKTHNKKHFQVFFLDTFGLKFFTLRNFPTWKYTEVGCEKFDFRVNAAGATSASEMFAAQLATFFSLFKNLKSEKRMIFLMTFLFRYCNIKNGRWKKNTFF